MSCVVMVFGEIIYVDIKRRTTLYELAEQT